MEVQEFIVFDVKKAATGYDIYIDPESETWITSGFEHPEPKPGDIVKIRLPKVLEIKRPKSEAIISAIWKLINIP